MTANLLSDTREQFRPDDHPTDHFLLTTVVGSYPKPKWLDRTRELYEQDVDDPELTVDEDAWQEAKDDAARLITEEHERSGLDVVVDGEMRRQAKAINFGILYGMGVNALKQALGTTRADAQQFLNAYFDRFSGIAQYVDAVKQQAAEKGYTETLFGRRRYFADIHSPQPHIRAAAERMAINAPIQGTQADIIKRAMIAVDERLEQADTRADAHLLLQVHDELVYELKESARETLIPAIHETMENVLSLEQTNGVPLATSVEVGTRWGSMEKQE
jgi:DNA polymerase-1